MTRSGYSPLPSLPKSPLSVCLPLANELELARLQEENKTPGRKGSRKGDRGIAYPNIGKGKTIS
jgi:hypothetical protein